MEQFLQLLVESVLVSLLATAVVLAIATWRGWLPDFLGLGERVKRRGNATSDETAVQVLSFDTNDKLIASFVGDSSALTTVLIASNVLAQPSASQRFVVLKGAKQFALMGTTMPARSYHYFSTDVVDSVAGTDGTAGWSTTSMASGKQFQISVAGSQ